MPFINNSRKLKAMLLYFELPYFLKEIIFNILFRFLNDKSFHLNLELIQMLLFISNCFYLWSTDGYEWPEEIFFLFLIFIALMH